jgi:organic hydroperoxide reductase OsmC/OhrA
VDARPHRHARDRASRHRPGARGRLRLAVALDLEAPGIDRAEAAELMARAHEICPYSRATRGNIDVTLAVAGVPIERAAA